MNFKSYKISFCLILFSVFSASAAKYNPVVNLSLYGGNYYLDGEASSFDWKFEAFASPSLILSENTEIYPVYMGYYNGTQDIQELAGGGVLTRQRQTHTVSLKYVHIKDFNKIKPRVSYTKALIQETKDESWGDGLFDYNTISAGVEFEQEKPHGTFTESYDYFKARYPNYASLISQSASIDTTTFNELSANAGTDVLDNASHRFAFSYRWFPGKMFMSSGLDFTYTTYGDQSLVSKTGAFKSDKRRDMTFGLDFKAQKPVKPLDLSFTANLDYLTSNQNSYDAARTKYIEDYYSYFQGEIGPALNFYFKNDSSFGYSLSFKKMYYLGRLAQDASGNYKASKVNQEFWLNSLYLRYPLMKKFFAKAIYSYQASSSNMRYEAGYRYNYRASTWLVGVDWEF